MMGLFSNQDPAGILADAALGAENVRNKYDNIALAQKNKQEARARQQAEAEAAEMAAQARKAQEQVGAAEEEKDALKARLLDFELAVDDVATIINSPSLNAAWKVSEGRVKAYSAKAEYRNDLAIFERRNRLVLQKVIDTLGKEYGIPSVKIQALIKSNYEHSCQNTSDSDIPQGIGEERDETYLFWDDKAKSLHAKKATVNHYIDLMNAAIDQLEYLKKVRAMRQAEKNAQNAPPSMR